MAHPNARITVLDRRPAVTRWLIGLRHTIAALTCGDPEGCPAWSPPRSGPNRTGSSSSRLIPSRPRGPLRPFHDSVLQPGRGGGPRRGGRPTRRRRTRCGTRPDTLGSRARPTDGSSRFRAVTAIRRQCGRTLSMPMAGIGLDYFPTQQFAINTAWLAVDILAVDPIAWPSTCSCMAIWPGQSRRRCTTACSTSPPDSPADCADPGCPLNAPGPGPATGHRARPAHHAARPARLTIHPVTTSGGSHRQNSTPATSPRPRAETTGRGSPSTVLHVEGIGDVMAYLAVGLPAF
jgi:hypothetical protein